MVYNNVILTVQDTENIARVAALLVEQQKLSLTEPGCERFEVYHSQSSPATFILVEQWQSEEHLTAHRAARGFTEIYQPQVLPLVERQPHLCDRL